MLGAATCHMMMCIFSRSNFTEGCTALHWDIDSTLSNALDISRRNDQIIQLSPLVYTLLVQMLSYISTTLIPR